MKSNYYSIVFILFVLFSCGTTKYSQTNAKTDALNALVTEKQFIIESHWAYPQSTNALQQVLNSGLLPVGSNSGSINLVGNSNFLKISGHTIASYLPYFGERQMQVGYGGGDSAIQFKGVMENYSCKKNKDNSYSITFDAMSNSEPFKVFIKLWPNLTTDLVLKYL